MQDSGYLDQCIGSLFLFIKNEDSCVSVRSLFGHFDDRPAQVFPLQHQLDLVVQFVERRLGGQSLQPVGTPSDKVHKKIDRQNYQQKEIIMKILIGYDGSNSAKKVLNLAREHAKAFEASVEVATSMQHGKENEKAEIEQAENSLDWVQSVFDADGLSCKTHLLIRGLTPGEDLVEFAKENDVAEIFVGVKRRSKVGKLLMGSTAQYVILNAPCPVVTAK